MNADKLVTDVYECLCASWDVHAYAEEEAVLMFAAQTIVTRLREGGISDVTIRSVLCGEPAKDAKEIHALLRDEEKTT